MMRLLWTLSTLCIAICSLGCGSTPPAHGDEGARTPSKGVQPADPNEYATFTFAPSSLKAKVIVNSEELGTVSDLAKEFRFRVVPGPNVLIVESDRYKTIYVTTFLARPAGVYTIENLHFVPKLAKILTADFACTTPGLPPVKEGGPAEAERVRYRKTYDRTREFWSKVIAANVGAKKRLDAMGVLTWNRDEKENKVHMDLSAEFGRFDQSRVDPDLLKAFNDMRECYRLVTEASYDNDKKLMDIPAISGMAIATKGKSLLSMPSVISKCQTTGDILFLAQIDLETRVKLLNAKVGIMDYRYGEGFDKLAPAFKQAVCWISAKIRDTWYD